MKTIFEIRPYSEYEKEIKKILSTQIKEFTKLKESLDFAVNHKIIDMCYVVKCEIKKSGLSEDVGRMSMQEVQSCFEANIINVEF